MCYPGLECISIKEPRESDLEQWEEALRPADVYVSHSSKVHAQKNAHIHPTV